MADVGKAPVLATLTLLCLAALPAAEARIQEYQVIRLISYHTSCDLAQLFDRSQTTGPMRFFATCGNLTSYPDGLEVVCADRDDDRSCEVTTPERTFRELELLTPKR